MGSETQHSRPRAGAPWLIVGERGSGRTTLAMRVAHDTGGPIHVVHGLETTTTDPWAPVHVGPEPPEVAQIAAAIADGVLVVDDAHLLGGADIGRLVEVADQVAVVAVVDATATAFTTARRWEVVTTAWPPAVDVDVVGAEVDAWGPDERDWVASWQAVADALGTVELPTSLVGPPPRRLADEGRARVDGDGRVEVWPALGRFVAGRNDVPSADHLLGRLASTVEDADLASDLFQAAGDRSRAGAAARRALATTTDPDRRAQLLVRVAEDGGDPVPACASLVARELVGTAAHLFADPRVPDDLRVARLRQLDDETGRWELLSSGVASTDVERRERLGLVDLRDLPALTAQVASAPAGAVDDLDQLRWRWGIDLLDAIRSGDHARLDAALADARSRSQRRAWASTATDLEALVDWHRTGTAEQLASDTATGDGPRVPVVVRAAHLVLDDVDRGRAADASDRLGATLVGPSPIASSLRRWCRIEHELAAGRVVTALRTADADAPTDDEPGPVDLLACVAHTWAAFDAGEPLPAAPASAPWPVLAPAIVEIAALHAWRADGATATTAAAFLEASRGWSGSHVRGALRCRWAAGEVLRQLGEQDHLPILREVEAAADRLGLLPLLARTRHSLRRAGARPATTRRVVAAEREGVESRRRSGLSDREREVLILTGKGLTARAIAQQLGVGVATVETQITSAMTKLGARTRVQAALMVAEGRDG